VGQNAKKNSKTLVIKTTSERDIDNHLASYQYYLKGNEDKSLGRRMKESEPQNYSPTSAVRTGKAMK
jgi:tRNA(Leu) C34 or U34 (ribose-2'-O)-methylase TrmL